MASLRGLTVIVNLVIMVIILILMVIPATRACVIDVTITKNIVTGVAYKQEDPRCVEGVAS